MLDVAVLGPGGRPPEMGRELAMAKALGTFRHLVAHGRRPLPSARHRHDEPTRTWTSAPRRAARRHHDRRDHHYQHPSRARHGRHAPHAIPWVGASGTRLPPTRAPAPDGIAHSLDAPAALLQRLLDVVRVPVCARILPNVRLGDSVGCPPTGGRPRTTFTGGELEARGRQSTLQPRMANGTSTVIAEWPRLPSGSAVM